MSSLPVPDRGRSLLSGLRRMPEANAALPKREREVLALLADDELSYAEIASVLAIDAAEIAALGGSGRLRLARALGLEFAEEPAGAGHVGVAELSASIDGETPHRPHVSTCRECRRLLAAMRMADRMYRSWATAPMPDGVRWRISRRLGIDAQREDR